MLLDKSIINAKVYSMENEGSVFEAFSIYDGKITQCGSNEDILKDPAKEVIDLNGKTVLPGFIDAHQHLLYYAKQTQTINLAGTKSWKEVKEILKEKAVNTPKGEWLHGVGFDHQAWSECALPTRKEMDEISKEHPIMIDRYCLHVHALNSEALRIAGITRDYKPMVENTMQVDEKGEPTGILWDSAIAPVLDILPDPLQSHEAKKEAIAAVIKDMNKYGITGTQPTQGKIVDSEEFIGIYQDLDREGRLTVRMYVNFDELPCFGIKTGFGNEKVKYGFYKMYNDGNLGSRSAAMLEPYSDKPDEIGILNYKVEEINEMCSKAYDMDIQIGIHAIGDRGLDVAVSAIEEVYRKNPKNDPRFRIIHAYITNEDLIQRMKKLPIILDIQPNFVATNIKWSEDRLGPERVKYAYPWRRLIDEGFILAASSDLPVEHFNPFFGVHAIVTRKNRDGFPEGGWYPEQRVTPYEAIEMYTKNAAYASYEEKIKGTISKGKLADFIVLDQDPFEIKIDELKDVKVEKTYLGGEEVFSIF